jgi:hypothetical protein
MTVPRRTRIKLVAFLAVITAVLVATFTRPSRDASDVAESDSVSASSDSERQPPQHARTRYSGANSGEPSAATPADPTLSGAQMAFDPAELARRRAERLALRAEQRARWEEHKREARSNARARALEQAKDSPEQVEYLKAQFARRDESDRLHEERREARRKLREERAANLGIAVPRPSDAPELGLPVIGADGVAYDPHARTASQ